MLDPVLSAAPVHEDLRVAEKLVAAHHDPGVDLPFEICAVGERVEAIPTDSVIGLVPSHAFEEHWAYADVLEHLGATYVRARWVEHGRFLTTASVSAGIDGGLYLAKRLLGEDAARLIQLGIEYEPNPPFGPIDWDPCIVGRAPTDLACTAPRASGFSPVPGSEQPPGVIARPLTCS